MTTYMYTALVLVVGLIRCASSLLMKYPETNDAVCQDIDTIACGRFVVQKADLCSDDHFATIMCRKFCGQCHQSSEYAVIDADGARWRAFWWYQKGSGWPTAPHDVLKDEFGSCNPNATFCFARLPKVLSETGTEILAKDSSGTIYRWAFDATNPTAHAAWRAFHDHIQTPATAVVNSHVWNPKVVSGKGPTSAQDSFMYRVEQGIASILLDDDNCDCISSLNIGHGMCGSTFSSTYINAGAKVYGVDLLSDTACHSPSPNNGLTLYFKDADDCAGVHCGPDLTCIDDIGTYHCLYL